MANYLDSTLGVFGDRNEVESFMAAAKTEQTDFDFEKLVPINPLIATIQAKKMAWEAEMKAIHVMLEKHWSATCMQVWILEEELEMDTAFVKYAIQTKSKPALHFVENLSKQFPNLLFVMRSETERYCIAKEWHIKGGKIIKAKEWELMGEHKDKGVDLEKMEIQMELPFSKKIMDEDTIRQTLGLVMAEVAEREENKIEFADPETDAKQKILSIIGKYWVGEGFYTAEEVEERFAIPPQFEAYLEKYGHIDQIKWRFLRSWKGIILDTTAYWYEYFSDEKEEYRAAGEYPMMLIDIGGWSDKHWYFMSCDKAHHFGKVYECYDTNFFDLPRIYDEQWNDFLTFLKSEFS